MIPADPSASRIVSSTMRKTGGANGRRRKFQAQSSAWWPENTRSSPPAGPSKRLSVSMRYPGGGGGSYGCTRNSPDRCSGLRLVLEKLRRGEDHGPDVVDLSKAAEKPVLL